MDMVGACNLLGVDIMTGHWEFTYREEEVLKNIEAFAGEFIAQNVRVTDEAMFDGAEAFDEDSGHVFRPYTLKTVGGRQIAVIGQAFPYTPIANPSYFIPDWTFGIRAAELQELVDGIRSEHSPDAIILLSHNGMDVDLKLASIVSGVDAILGGHTHDGVPIPEVVGNPGGKTLVTNAGSNGKFLAVLDLDIGDSGLCYIAGGTSTALSIKSSAMHKGLSGMPRSPCHPVSAGARASCLDRPLRWNTYWTKPASPIRKPTYARYPVNRSSSSWKTYATTFSTRTLSTSREAIWSGWAAWTMCVNPRREQVNESPR